MTYTARYRNKAVFLRDCVWLVFTELATAYMMWLYIEIPRQYRPGRALKQGHTAHVTNATRGPSLVRSLSLFVASAFVTMSVSSQHEGLCLRYPEPLGQQASISYEAAVSLLLRAIQLAQHTPFVWGYIDKPQGSCARYMGILMYLSALSQRDRCTSFS